MLPCVDVDLGSALPVSELGSTVGGFDDFFASCAAMGGNDEDFVFSWTAPSDGDFVFDTYGSSIDTILTVMEDCWGPELACNDDASGGLQSEVTVSMSAGQTVIVIVDGWNEAGDFMLNIGLDEGGGDGGTECLTGTSCDPNANHGFGDCGGGASCDIMGEVCFTDMAMTVQICVFLGCAVPTDCPPPDPALGGTAPIVCTDVNFDMVAEECALDCSMGQACPTGMVCFESFLCVWP